MRKSRTTAPCRFEETSDSRDTQSIAYLYECLEKLAEEINEGRIKRKHIKDVLKDECGVTITTMAQLMDCVAV